MSATTPNTNNDINQSQLIKKHATSATRAGILPDISFVISYAISIDFFYFLVQHL